MTLLTTTIFSGKAYRVEKRNVFRDEPLAAPEGSLLLHAEVVIGDDVEALEVWIAVPQDADVVESTTHLDAPAVSLPVTRKVSTGLGDTETPTEDDDEFYADY